MMLLKVLKNKKGIVMETAIIFMVAVFSFCFLLSGLTIGAHYRAKAESVKIDRGRSEELDETILAMILNEYLVYMRIIEVPPKIETPSGETETPSGENKTPDAGESAQPAGQAEGDEQPEGEQQPEQDPVEKFNQAMSEYKFEDNISDNLQNMMYLNGYTIVAQTPSFDANTGKATFSLSVLKNGVFKLLVQYTKEGTNPPIQINYIPY